MNILLTGGSGFLGSALATQLDKLGHQVALLLRPASRLDRLSVKESSFEIGRYTSNAEVTSFVQRAYPDVVIHTACTYGRQGESIVQLVDTNIRFGLSIIDSLLSKEYPITFINIGTVLDPQVSTYALTKRQFSDLGRLIAMQSPEKLRFINVLLQHMYGPGDDPTKFTSKIVQACCQNHPELKLTLGEQRRDFIYIDDVVSALMLLVEKHEQFPAYKDIDLGSGYAPTLKTFVESVHRLTTSDTKLNFGAIPYRLNEVMFSQADISELQALGWQPRFDLETGLKQTIELELSK